MINSRNNSIADFMRFKRDSQAQLQTAVVSYCKKFPWSLLQPFLQTHGLAEFIAQEEMDRKNGYWWSLDSKLIALTEVVSSGIPLFRIMHQGKNSVSSQLHMHRKTTLTPLLAVQT